MNKLLIIISLFVFLNSQAQVLGPKNIVGQYRGDTKKNLANGKGQSTGQDKYIGKFKKGFPNGKGELRFGKDTVLKGESFQKGDKYIGNFTNGEFNGSGKVVYINRSKETKIGYWTNGTYTGKTKDGYLITTESNVEVDCQFVAEGPNEIRIIGMSNIEVPAFQGIEFDGNSTITVPESMYPVTLSISGIVSADGARGMFKIWIEKQGVWHISLSPQEL